MRPPDRTRSARGALAQRRTPVRPPRPTGYCSGRRVRGTRRGAEQVHDAGEKAARNRLAGGVRDGRHGRLVEGIGHGRSVVVGSRGRPAVPKSVFSRPAGSCSSSVRAGAGSKRGDWPNPGARRPSPPRRPPQTGCPRSRCCRDSRRTRSRGPVARAGRGCLPLIGRRLRHQVHVMLIAILADPLVMDLVLRGPIVTRERSCWRLWNS